MSNKYLKNQSSTFKTLTGTKQHKWTRLLFRACGGLGDLNGL